MIAFRNILTLRRPRSGCLEGRAALIQKIFVHHLAPSGYTPLGVMSP
jgi:hypothetical protein